MTQTATPETTPETHAMTLDNLLESVSNGNFNEESSVDFANMTINKGERQLLAESLPKLVPDIIADDLRQYCANGTITHGYQSATLLLSASATQAGIPRSTFVSNGVRNTGALNGVVTGEGGSGKSRILKPIAHLMKAIVVAVRAQDRLFQELVEAWNDMLTAIHDEVKGVSDGDKMDPFPWFKSKPHNQQNALSYNQILKRYKRLGLFDKNLKSNGDYKFTTLIRYVSKFTQEGVIDRMVQQNIQNEGMKAFIYLAKWHIAEQKASGTLSSEMTQVEMILSAIDGLHRGLIDSHLAIQLDEVNKFLKPVIEGGKASEVCDYNEYMEHGYGAKSDAERASVEDSETAFSMFFTGATTRLNTVRLVSIPDTIDTGFYGRQSQVNVVRGNDESAPVTIDVTADDTLHVDTTEMDADASDSSELRLNYYNAICGLMLATFPYRYHRTMVKATASQNVLLKGVIADIEKRYQGEDLEPNRNRFPQNHAALTIHAHTYMAAMADVAKLIPAIQSWSSTSSTGEVFDMSLASYVGMEGIVAAAWWNKTDKVTAFIEMMRDHLGASAKDVVAAETVSDELFEACLQIMLGSMESAKQTISDSRKGSTIQRSTQKRAENDLRKMGDTSMMQIDYENMLKEVQSWIGANPGATISDASKALKSKSKCQAVFAKPGQDRAGRCKVTAAGVKSAISALIKLGRMTETTVTTGGAPKTVVSIVAILTPEEITTTAASLIASAIPEEIATA